MDKEECLNAVVVPTQIIYKYLEEYENVKDLWKLDSKEVEKIILSKIKEGVCDFLMVLSKTELLDKFLQAFSELKDYSLHRRFLVSISIYTKVRELYHKLEHTEDNIALLFLLLCTAVESLKRYDLDTNTRNTDDFVNFFIDNLPSNRIREISSKFKIIGPEKYLKILFPNICINPTSLPEMKKFAKIALKYLYSKRSEIVHEGRLYGVPSLENSYFEEVSTDTMIKVWRYKVPRNKMESVGCKDKVPIIVADSLDIETLFEFYEEALLNMIKRGDP